jgi:hypothetical protein
MLTLKKGQSYSLKLVGTGYSFSEPAYVGWCNGYDLGKYDSTTVPADIYQSPLDLEIWNVQKNENLRLCRRL